MAVGLGHGSHGRPCGNHASVFTYEAIGSDQDVYWVNETFDALYYEGLETMDNAARHEITDQMQAIAYEMRGCQCIAYRDELYAVNTEYWAVESLGDWNTEYFLLPDVWNWWSSMYMYPNRQRGPRPVLTTRTSRMRARSAFPSSSPRTPMTMTHDRP